MDEHSEQKTEKEKQLIKDPQTDIRVKSSRRRKIGANAPKIIRIIIFGGLALLILLLIIISGLFDLDQVEVTDVEGRDPKYVDHSSIQTIVEERYLGENFFFSDPNEIKHELIENDPYIKDVWIEKLAPRKLHVVIREKDPFMYIQFEGECILVDDTNAYITAYPTVIEERAQEEEGSDGSDTGEANQPEPYDCRKSAQSDLAYFVDFQGDHYEFIIKESKFFLYDQIVQSINLLDHYGIITNEAVIGDRLLAMSTEDGKVILIDPFDQFDIQLKRLVLILNQIRWGDQDFAELDLRYKRPVMRSEKTT